MGIISSPRRAEVSQLVPPGCPARGRQAGLRALGVREAPRSPSLSHPRPCPPPPGQCSARGACSEMRPCRLHPLFREAPPGVETWSSPSCRPQNVPVWSSGPVCPVPGHHCPAALHRAGLFPGLLLPGHLLPHGAQCGAQVGSRWGVKAESADSGSGLRNVLPRLKIPLSISHVFALSLNIFFFFLCHLYLH